MTLVEFLMKNWIVIAFYVVIIALIIIYRKKFEFQGRIIALRRTKIGIKWMERMGHRHGEKIKILGYIGIGVGFVGMLTMFGYVLKVFIELFTNPAAPAAFAPVLPGVNIPGSPIYIPLWVIFALFVVVALHEAGHGLVARAHKLKIDSTGIVFFGPLIGAFVEPNEKQLDKQSDVVKYSVFAAGPFANALTAAIALLLMVVLINPLTAAMVSPVGFSVAQVQEGLPAQVAGMQPNTVYTTFNGVNITSTEDLEEVISLVGPGENVTITNDNSSLVITTVQHPQKPYHGYLGVVGIKTETVVKEGVPMVAYHGLRWIAEFIFWIFVLSLGLGAFNLLPLGPVDGGQMFRLASWRIFGKKKGNYYWAKLGLFLLILILILVFLPIIRSVIAG